LYPVDLKVAYTDAIVEFTNRPAKSGKSRVFFAPVKRCRTWPPEDIVEAAFAALAEFSGDNQTDEATILAVLVH
jgi:serine phosphatase RsbU (regulator of sigma subunit)